MQQTLTITRPDDWHVHLRDGSALKTTVNHSAAVFQRAIIMPNLKPPVTTTQMALDYRQRILAALDKNLSFEPLMTLYLTDHTTPQEIEKAKSSGHIIGAKLYPSGATTNSEFGVSNLEGLDSVFKTMEAVDLPLLLHGEVTDPTVDVFAREQVFIENQLTKLVADYPKLRIVLEHISTAAAVTFITQAPHNIAATITPQHLLINRNALFEGGIKPHHYCLPVLKKESDRIAIVAAATSGNPKFFLGTDSAPHQQQAKESACGCAGIYSAHAAIELYVMAFYQVNALDKLEGFCSFFGADFYRLPRNNSLITLNKEPWTVPTHYALGQDKLIPFYAGEQLDWKVSSI